MTKPKYSNLKFMYAIDGIGYHELKEDFEMFKEWPDDDEMRESLNNSIEGILEGIEKLMMFPQIKKPYKAGEVEHEQKFKRKKKAGKSTAS